VIVLGSAPGRAQLTYSPDTTVLVSGTLVADEDIAEDDLAGGVVLGALGALPESVEVDGHARVGAAHLFSLDTAATLPGGLFVRPADVVRYDGVAYVLAFDATASGLGADVDDDALSVDGASLVLSFDTTVDLGGGLVVSDEDLVEVVRGSFALRFDGSAAGLDPALDLDAVHVGPAGSFFASFDRAGSIGGVAFDDDSILLYSGSAWSRTDDVSSRYSAFGPADVISVPEPAPGLVFVAGLFLLAILVHLKGPRLRGCVPVAAREETDST
jgi:hypothetical protein